MLLIALKKLSTVEFQADADDTENELLIIIFIIGNSLRLFDSSEKLNSIENQLDAFDSTEKLSTVECQADADDTENELLIIRKLKNRYINNPILAHLNINSLRYKIIDLKEILSYSEIDFFQSVRQK